MAESREYRVVYRAGERTRGLGRVHEVTPTLFTLDPFLSRLRLGGVVRGEILLVEATTNRIVARRDVRVSRR